MKKFFLIVIVVLLVWPNLLWAACSGSGLTWTCTYDSTATQINTAISSASDGATITFTGSGSVTWSSTITIPNTKGITLKGPGSFTDRDTSPYGTWPMIVTSNQSTAVSINCGTGRQLTRISGFEFRGSVSQFITVDGIGMGPSPNYYGAFRIDNNKFSGIAASQMIFLQAGDGENYGLIDSNYIYDSGRTDGYAIAVWEYYQPGGNDCWGINSWERSFTRGDKNYNFIENNRFENINQYTRHYIEAELGGRYVARYNTVKTTNSGGSMDYFEAHGLCMMNTNGAGARGGEIYANTFQGSGSTGLGRNINLRGGHWLIYDNTFTALGYSSSPINLTDYRSSTIDCSQCSTRAGCSSEPACLDESPNYYPADQAIFNTYLWNNIYGGTNRSPELADENYVPFYIQANRDYFVSTSKPAALSSYTPYTYPHPLRETTNTYYLSPSGSDSYTTTQAKNSATPWKTFSKAFTNMVAGDTLNLLNGSYGTAAGTGYISYLGTNSAQPPSGTSKTVMTTVQAVNEGSVTINGGLFIGRSTRKDSYIKIKGITFIGGQHALYNTSYNYIKNCGFYGADQDGGGVFGIGTNDGPTNTYNLIEDCWIWGKNRLIASNYMSDSNVWRRVVVRGDGCNTSSCTGSGNPNVGFTVYNSINVSVQNMIIVDRILGGGEQYANFASAQHDPGSALGPAEWLGCLSLKAPDEGWYLEADTANPNAVKISNSIAWDSAGEGFNLSMSTSGLDFQNNTAGVSNAGSGVRIVNFSSGTVRNAISYDSSLWGFNSNITPSYVDTYLADGGLYNQTTPTVGVKTTNPRADGTPASITYIPRIEAGSALKGTGYSGLDYGANIVYRYGTDGTYYGDSGYNTLTATALWPWPNEARIKSDMAVYSTIGFCASTVNPRTNTGYITLTSYIWEYLGNTGATAGLYGGVDTAPPTPNPATFSSSPSPVSTSQIDMTATSASDATTPVSYLITFNACASNGGTGGTSSSWQTSNSYSDTGLSPNKCYGYTVQSRDAVSPTPNTGTVSAVSQTYTHAAIPGAPTFGTPTTTTVPIYNTENGNPSSSPTTEFAIQCVTTSDSVWINKYVNSSGGGPSSSPVWASDAIWNNFSITGLQQGTLYGFKAQARNYNSITTALGSEGQITTAVITDTSPPTPNPATFATSPNPTSETVIAMIATTGSDSTTPVSYLFTYSSCASNPGTGGTSSSWQTSTSYSDIGLQANKCYGYTVTSRDAVSPTPNTGSASSVSQIYTRAYVPGTPTFGTITTTTAVIYNDINGNPTTSPITNYAWQCTYTSPNDSNWNGKWLNTSGSPVSSAVWAADSTWDGVTLIGLSSGTIYGFKAQARNQNSVVTNFSSEGQFTTLTPPSSPKNLIITGGLMR